MYLFCFMKRKDHFKQKLLLWPQVPFKFKVLSKLAKRHHLTSTNLLVFVTISDISRQNLGIAVLEKQSGIWGGEEGGVSPQWV